jgi:aminoglycoside phosphotransferase family enzyme/predicted kinase
MTYATQQALVRALCKPACYPHPVKAVHVLETHISWVLLAGRYAYKIKKAIDLGFLDCSELTARRFYCAEEIRLNRRLAPNLYLDVVSIGGNPQQPAFGVTPAIEYAVRMRRFDIAKQMDGLLAHGLITPQHIDRLADTMAQFHAGLPPTAADSAFGTPEAIRFPMLQNFEQISPLLDEADALLLGQLRAASEQEYAACETVFEQRRQQGWVRECHGDLHLGNIVLLKDQPTPFDGIDFNPALRWIDVISEVAFLVMDLQHRSRGDLAFRFVNRYLELSGDYAGLRVLRFYLAYRAVVRAKVSAIRAHQQDTPSQQAQFAMKSCRAYLAQAMNSLEPSRPSLVIMHGLPGCGKTTVAQAALERLQVIRIRSDVERKRLFGLLPQQASHSEVGGGIYSAEATRLAYDKLHQLARKLLSAGFTVIVDAAFTQCAERQRFQQLAKEMALPFVILEVRANPVTIKRRIRQRLLQAGDASEADLAVYRAMSAAHQPLQVEELAAVVYFANNGEVREITQNISVWRELLQKIVVT